MWLLIWSGTIAAAITAKADPVTCRPAELFATDNTDDELGLFELQADVMITQSGAMVTGSTPLDGVFWSPGSRQVTYERSREFHLCSADEPTLHTAAEAVRSQFNQESVLTFDYLPDNLPSHPSEANAVLLAVPDIDTARFRAAFAADSAAHRRLLGGSVTTTDHTLILVAGNDDLDVARRLVDEAGGDWNAATITYGRREFVVG